MLSRKTLSVEQYKDIVSNSQNIKRQEVLDHKLTLNDFIQKLEDNNVYIQVRHENGNN